MGRHTNSLARYVALIFTVAACSKTAPATAPDAGLSPPRVENAELGFKLELPPTWNLESATKSAPERIAEARRRPAKDHPFTVAPRFVITAERTDLADVAAVVEQTSASLRAFTREEGVELERMSTTTRQVTGVPVGDIELAYRVRGKDGDTVSKVVHRSFVTRRTKKDGSAVALTMTATYLAEDQDLALPDVLRIISSVHFSGPSASETAEPR